MNHLPITKIISKFYIFVTVFLFVLPIFVYADPAPTPEGGIGITYECKDGDCTFDDLIAATRKFTNFGASFALMFSVVVIAYAGAKYMISGANAKERGEANAMMVKVLKGIGFILGAWLIVTLILNSLGVSVVFSP